MKQVEIVNSQPIEEPKFLRICIIYLVIILLNLLWAATYTYDLGFVWIPIILISPIVGAIIGFVTVLAFSSIFKKIKLSKLTWKDSLVVVFSIILSISLTFEEMGCGLMRKIYQKHISELDTFENSKPVHEIALGAGKILYFESKTSHIFDRFASETQKNTFALNFEYQGAKQITQAKILELAKSYCLSKGYEIEKVNYLSLYGPSYRKTGFMIRKTFGEVIIDIKIKNGPIIDKHWKLTGLTLRLIYSDNQLNLEQYGYEKGGL